MKNHLTKTVFQINKLKRSLVESKFSLDIVIPLSSSLIYRDMVLFEGLETGIEHEWPIPIVANQETVMKN